MTSGDGGRLPPVPTMDGRPNAVSQIDEGDTMSVVTTDLPTAAPPAARRDRSGAVAISTRGLARRFADLDAVAGVDLDVAAGEIYGFLGPNGAGKSTTVRMLCTLLAPTAGHATVAGFDIVERPDQVRLHIGVALQEAALDPGQTGRELLRLQGMLYGLRPRDATQRAGELGELIDLGDALDRPIKGYSGGMKRRLDLAAALVHNPDVLFLDEPTTGLDPVSRQTVWTEVQRLNQELGMTIFLTTQYLEEADVLADRVGIIDGGRLVAEGTPTELKRQVGADLIIVTIDGDAAAGVPAVRQVPGVLEADVHGHELVVSTENGAAAVGDVVVALRGADVTIRELAMRSPTLDDVFLELTGNRIAMPATDATHDSTSPEQRGTNREAATS
jgi:ABC-2 type transport system ATP-binding protein